MATEKQEVTTRDLAVWGAYVGSALALSLMEAHPDENEGLLKAQSLLAEGKTSGLAKAVKDALKVCVPDTAAHPVRQGEVRRARINLEAVLAELTGETPDGEPASEKVAPAVCIHCGWKSRSKTGATLSASLAKHIASKHP